MSSKDPATRTFAFPVLLIVLGLIILAFTEFGTKRPAKPNAGAPSDSAARLRSALEKEGQAPGPAEPPHAVRGGPPAGADPLSPDHDAREMEPEPTQSREPKLQVKPGTPVEGYLDDLDYWGLQLDACIIEMELYLDWTPSAR